VDGGDQVQRASSSATQERPRRRSRPRFAVVYDDEAMFVGVWADDPHPELVRALLTRRDADAPADSITVAFDSYHDRRTAYAFQLNAAGVQRDMLLFDDSGQDDTWDAVWTGKVAMTPAGDSRVSDPTQPAAVASIDVQEWGSRSCVRSGATANRTAGRRGRAPRRRW